MAKKVVVTVSDLRGGHDGAGTGGSYGSVSFLIASRSEILKIVESKNESTSRPGRITTHQNNASTSYEVLVEKMREDDFVFLVSRYDANPYLRGSQSRYSRSLVAGKEPEEYPPSRFSRLDREYNDMQEAWEERRAEAALAHVLAKDPEGFAAWDKSVHWYWEPSQEKKALKYLFDRSYHTTMAGKAVKEVLMTYSPVDNEEGWSYEKAAARLKESGISWEQYIEQYTGFHFPEMVIHPPEQGFVKADAYGVIGGV